jgi:hypothetical protein
MHIAVSWDITAEGDRWKQIDETMREALRNYSWVRPLSTFYVVKIGSEGDRQLIQNSLVNVAKSAGARIHYLITPAMLGGQYQGYLPADDWTNVKARTA